MDTIKVLLKHAANALAVSKQGQTAAQLAKTAEVRAVLQAAESRARERQYHKAQKGAAEKAAGGAGPQAGSKKKRSRQGRSPWEGQGQAIDHVASSTAAGLGSEVPYRASRVSRVGASWAC
jgi:hypothetical protein